MDASRKLRVAVIGMGPIGNLHARLYRKDSLAELVGVCDRIPERARAAGAQHGVPHFADALSMLAALKPDVVSVATGGFEYASDHAEPTIQAIEAGAHVLVEKPISNDLAAARAMVAAARERGRSLAVNFNHRFTPAALAARRWLDGGELGERLFCNMALWIGRAGAFETPNYHLKALDPHAVNMMEWFCGPIEAVQAFAVRASGRNFWSTASINVRFVCGAVGHLTSSYDIERGHPMERCEVAGVKGRFVVEDMWREATLYPAGNPEKRVVTNPVFGGYRDFDDTFAARLRRFLEQVAAGDPPERIDGSGADGVRTTEVIHAAIRSLDEGNRAVRVDEMA